MPYNVTLYRILIASPSDVAEERKIIKEGILSWNASNCLKEKVVLEPVLWETHSIPQMGERPQEILNKQIVRSCDILIGIFWTRLGTNTGKADSGTVEEIEEFRKEKKPVLLYFSGKPVMPISIDSEQYKRLVNYRKKCKNEGLIDTFDTLGDLRFKFNRHLNSTIMLLNEKPETEVNVVEEALSNKIISKVADFYNVSKKGIYAKGRKKEYAEARQIAMYLIKTKTRASLKSIGDIFNRDHSTVIHAISVIESRIECDTNFSEELAKLERLLKK